MGEPDKAKNRKSTTVKYLGRAAVTLAVLVLLVVLAALMYLSTPLAARNVSQLASSFLHQTVVIDRLETTGSTIYLRGVRLENPAGFAKGNLATLDSVAIVPSWSDLLLGRQSYRLMALEGLNVNLEKNSRGAWNFSELQHWLAQRKPSPTETRIQRLLLKNGAIRVNGKGLQGISLQLFNLATKGSRKSDIDLSFEDGGRNRFTLKGQVRPGTEPDLDLTLDAPVLALDRLAPLVQLKVPELLKGGTGSLQLAASLHRKELTSTGNLRFGNMHYSVAGKRYPLSGRLELAANYSMERDTARVRTCRLVLDDLVQVRATGSLHDLKKAREFALDLGFSEVDLAKFTALLPDKTRNNLELGGHLAGRNLHLAGRGNQLTSATGVLQLRGGRATREGRLLVSDLGGELQFSRGGEGVLARGRFFQQAAESGALVEALELPFSLALSRQMKPVRAEVPALSARVLGVAFSGRVGYQARQENPLTVSLKVPSAKLANLQSLWRRYDLSAQSGTASVTLEATGRDLQQVAATVGVRLADLQGKRGKNGFTVKTGALNAKVRRAGGHLAVQGDADLRGLFLDGKGGDARFNFRLADRQLNLDNGRFAVAGAEISLAQLSSTLPVRGAAGSGTPVALDFSGAALRRKDLEVASLGGRLHGKLFTEGTEKWLEGTGELSSGRVAWKGTPVAAPAVRFTVSRPGAKVDLGGSLAGGALSGTVSANPFAPAAGVRFEAALTEAQLAAVAPFFPRGTTVPSEGNLGLRLSGSYSKSAGLACRLDSRGSKITLAKPGGKTLLSGAGFSLVGDLAADQLAITEAVLAPGPGVALKVTGNLARPFSPQRSGRLSFALAETSANALVDPLANMLPRVLQEATLDGALAAEGRLDLAQNSKLLEGTLSFKGGRFELAQQKLQVSGINGRFPFSLDLSGKSGAKPVVSMDFSRQNFPKLLEQLRRQRGAGEVVKVDKIAFGPLELGTLTMHLSAARGTTEISSLSSSLYEGAILGKGFLSLQQGVNYRGDLLVNGLSLRKLCSIFPGFQGYISGRVDGVLSISGGSRGLAGITGFTELWAREGAGEKMLVSKEFLQRLAKQKLSGFFFRSDRSYDAAEIKALMEEGYLTFESLKIVHTNFFGVKDLNVSIAPTQNRIALDHLLDSVKQAASRGKGASAGGQAPEAAPEATPPTQEFKWGE